MGLVQVEIQLDHFYNCPERPPVRRIADLGRKAFESLRIVLEEHADLSILFSEGRERIMFPLAEALKHAVVSDVLNECLPADICPAEHQSMPCDLCFAFYFRYAIHLGPFVHLSLSADISHPTDTGVVVHSCVFSDTRIITDMGLAIHTGVVEHTSVAIHTQARPPT